eukprot:TRINITY_DN15089_c0_g1_i1.p1 TRINITY_DN15089_c0_g1~~TRINITY_DN15089_c0_g1_i1.p1  ORF type:complete len:348 (-),score=55.16 TRINITY_DN15089_c0_g1_i1:22-1020(-)
MATPGEVVIPIIDAHHHLWDLDGHKYLWIKGPDQIKDQHCYVKDWETIRHSYLVDEYKTEFTNKDGPGSVRFQLTKSVHVQCNCSDGPLEEATYLQKYGDDSGFPNAIVAFADLAKPLDELEPLLADLTSLNNVRGIRQMLNYDKDNTVRSFAESELMVDSAFLRGLALLPKYNLTFDLQINPEQMELAATVIKDHPDVTFIVNHCFCPSDNSESGVAKWKERVTKFAQDVGFVDQQQQAGPGRVLVKVSGFGMFFYGSSVTTEKIFPYVEHMVGTFGIDASMFASNFPVDRPAVAGYALYTCFYDCCLKLKLDAESMRKLFHDNAERVYRI